MAFIFRLVTNPCRSNVNNGTCVASARCIRTIISKQNDFLGWDSCASLFGQSQCSPSKTFISDKVTEARKERLVRMEKPLTCFCASQAPWEHGRSDWLWVSWEKERETKERERGEAARRLSGFSSWFRLPSDSLYVAHGPVTHAWAQTHGYTWTATSHFTRAPLMLQQMNMKYAKRKKTSISSFQLSRYVCTVGPHWLHHWNENCMTESVLRSVVKSSRQKTTNLHRGCRLETTKYVEWWTDDSIFNFLFDGTMLSCRKRFLIYTSLWVPVMKQWQVLTPAIIHQTGSHLKNLSRSHKSVCVCPMHEY